MTAAELDAELEAMRDVEAATDQADGFIKLEPDDYDEVMAAIGRRGEGEVKRALSWLCLMKQCPRRGPWYPGAEVQMYLRALEGEQ